MTKIIEQKHFEGSLIEKGFVNTNIEKSIPTIEQIESKLNDNLSKGLIDQELFDKASEELKILKDISIDKK